ncbi:YciI family protein [Pedobacter sp. NJ-S-72]
MFIVSITYKVSIDLIETHLAAHVTYLKEQYALGNFILSGRKEPRTGGIILSNADSITSLKAILDKDPFKKLDLGDYVITEFLPSMAGEEFTFLLNY